MPILSLEKFHKNRICFYEILGINSESLSNMDYSILNYYEEAIPTDVYMEATNNGKSPIKEIYIKNLQSNNKIALRQKILKVNESRFFKSTIRIDQSIISLMKNEKNIHKPLSIVLK